MLVDPAVLRAFAGQVNTVAGVISRADIGNEVSTSAAALPGSTSQWAAHSVGAHFSVMAAKLAKNVTTMGTAVRGAGDTYEVADDALAGQFDGLF